MDQLSKDIDSLFLIANSDKKMEYVRNNIHNHLDNPLYFSGIFIMVNTNYEKITLALPIILNAYDNLTQRCKFIKLLMNKSVKLNQQSRFLIIKLVFSSKYFKEFIKYSAHSAKVTAKEEQVTGLFCLMFMSNTMSLQSVFNDIQNLLLNRYETYEELLKYFGKLVELNSPYVDCDEHKCYTECSNDDLNMFIMYTTLKMCREKPDIMCSVIYEEIVGKMINNLFASKMRIRNLLLSKRNEFNELKNYNAVEMITVSINRLEETMNDIVLVNFVKENIGYAIDDIDSSNKLENLCWMICNYFTADEDIKSLRDICTGECLISYLETLNLETSKNDITSSVMAVGMVLEKLGYILDDPKTLITFNDIAIDSIKFLQLYKPDWLSVIKNTNGFVLLLKNIMSSVKITHSIIDKVIGCINDFTDKCDQSLYLDIIHIYQQKDVVSKEIQDKCLEMINKFLQNYKGDNNENIISRLKEILVNCKMSRFEINKMKIRFGSKYPFLNETLEHSLSLLDSTREKIKDHFFRDKIIEQPIFVATTSDDEIVIDESTLESDVFIKYIEGNTTVDEIKKYNKLPKYINKRIEFMAILSIHKKHKNNS
jgi:hypothetical protein